MTSQTIKMIGLAVSIIGAGLSLVTNWIDEKRTDEKISEKINEALANKMKD